MTTTPDLDLSAGSYVKGIMLSETSFMAVTTFQQLRGITRDPEHLQPNRKLGNYIDERLEEDAEMHELIQRALSGSKRSNVASYRQYIEELVNNGTGVLPPMHLWSRQKLDIVQSGTHSYIVVPNAEHLFAIDGETQLTAHWRLASGVAQPEVKALHAKYPLSAIVHHGLSIQVARQYFHDLNVLAVRPNTSLGLAMDTKDPVMKVVGDVEALDVLMNRVDKQNRQVKRNSPKLVTLQALRQMVVNVAKGISGIQYGARPAPIDELDQRELSNVATTWIGAYFNEFQTQIADRDGCLAGSAPVLAAVGALAQPLLAMPASQRPYEIKRLMDSLSQVDWTKGDHWIGIAGGPTASGAFSVKGTKEVAYAIYNVLSDPSNAAYNRVRRPAHLLS